MSIPTLGKLIGHALSLLRTDPATAGALLTELAPVTPDPPNTVPCLSHGGHRCVLCGGSGYEQAPTDIPGWLDRAARCGRLAQSTLLQEAAEWRREQEGHAWREVFALSPDEAKPMALRCAVVAYNLAHKPEEAREFVIEQAAHADAYTLMQVGDVGKAILLRRQALTTLAAMDRSKAHLGPTAHVLREPQ